jgi:hypothetical protein
MKQSLLHEKYPLFILELARDETDYDSVDAICEYFRERIESHRCGRFIAIFDHYAHTCNLPEGHVGEGIRAAKNVIFCFGIALPSAEVLAVRPADRRGPPSMPLAHLFMELSRHAYRRH